MAVARLLLLLALAVPGSGGEEAEVVCADSACYTLHRDELDWKGAQERCRHNGGNLASVGGPGEAARLRELLEAAGAHGPAWIGLWLQRGHCVQPQEPLRGFSWVAGGTPGNFSAWASEPSMTCTSARCASLRPPGPHGPAGWADRPCRLPLPAFLCKFSFQGMCGLLPLAGPGRVTYGTPFGVRSSRLAAAPFGTLAEVECEGGRSPAFALCKGSLDGGGFAWDPPGPLCPVACAHRNGGCQHRCLEAPGEPPRCSCHAGYSLAADMASCVPEDSCHPNPCQGTCRARPGGFECGCEAGYALAPDGRSCLDVDECLSGPCQHQCHNLPGSFRCACRPGYQRQPGGDSCLDVDECLRDPCPGPCRNLPGGYECLCPPGFLPEEEEEGGGRGCRAAAATAAGEEPAEVPDGPTGTPSIPPSIPPSTGAPWTARTPRSTGASGTTSIPRTPGMPAGVTPTGAEEGAAPPGPDEHSADGPRLLLYYILGSLVAILLLLAFALALVACRRRAAKKEKRPAKSAADNYCWVPEQPESRGQGGERR
ncbi:LOW QUALITY PROTEIN: complement component C1q receptor [Neopelma chrysocephalum]|uniref:LOW QUALITY PROTEIN: complement component C1q receptor n=1 Tax=Neopelma chrysocephalum TaxID=114329 RepID=UPI000FCD0EFF|nr:LOW QUALITY PROTEIN: complement component C1q receptor [Neopelma chrysocephalum]